MTVLWTSSWSKRISTPLKNSGPLLPSSKGWGGCLSVLNYSNSSSSKVGISLISISLRRRCNMAEGKWKVMIICLKLNWRHRSEFQEFLIHYFSKGIALANFCSGSKLSVVNSCQTNWQIVASSVIYSWHKTVLKTGETLWFLWSRR